MNDADKLLRRGLLLEYLTLGWNVGETVIIIFAGVRANSVALVGFGLDSLIEIVASIVVVWQLKGTGKDRERTALRLISIAFLALAIYISIQSARTLFMQAHPDTSLIGIISLILTVAAMFILAAGKGRVGKQLNNPVLITEARVTMLDGLLAASVLIGLLFNTFFGWWWADPLAGLVIVFYGFKEGLHAWTESNS